MKIVKRAALFFPHNPWPFVEGSQKRFRQTLAAFAAAGCEVHLLSAHFFSERSWNADSIAALKKLGVREVYVCAPNAFDRWFCSRLLKKHRAGGALFNPAYLNPPFFRMWVFKTMLQLRPDIFWVDYAFWAGLTASAGCPAAVDMIDLLSSNEAMKQRLRPLLNTEKITEADIAAMPGELFEPHFWDKLRSEIRPEEIRAYNSVRYSVAITKRESALLGPRAVKTKVLLLPYREPACPMRGESSGESVLFPAGSHIFNIHSYVFFIKKIWPFIAKEEPEFRLRVTGSLKGKVPETPGVELLPFAPDLENVYRGSRFAVCPVIAGTGQLIKTVEAMSRGLAVVTTPFGAEGSTLVHGESGFIAGSPEEFARFTLMLWRDPDLCARMGQKAAQSLSGPGWNRDFEDAVREMCGEAR